LKKPLHFYCSRSDIVGSPQQEKKMYQNTAKHKLSALFSLVAFIGCQGKEFDGKKPVAAVTAGPASTAGATTPGGTQNPGNPSGTTNSLGATGVVNPGSGTGATTMTSGAVGVNFSPDVTDTETMKKCLNQWTIHPFATVTKANSKSIGIGVAVGPFQIGGVNDLSPSPEPQLVVVNATLNLGGKATYKMLNPNGWYCLKLNFSLSDEKNIADTTWRLECNAKLSESELDLGLSTTAQIVGNTNKTGAQLGVHINPNRPLVREKYTGGACP
jgi:hypothetical protein